MHAQCPKPVKYPRSPAHERRRPPHDDLPGPRMSRNEVLVTVGIILILLAILVPVVRMVRESAEKAAAMQRDAADLLMLEQ